MSIRSKAPLTVLLVDDDAVDRAAVRRALRASGLAATVNELDDADAVRAELLARPPDCLLLDLQLPRVDGVDLLRALRADGVDTPVIILTGHGDEQTAVDLMKAGATDYLSKSALSPERLSKSITHAVRVSQAERETARARDAVDSAERRYRFLAESIPQMVWVCDDAMRFEYVNERWTAYTGLELSAMRDAWWQSTVHPDDLPTFLSRWHDVREAGDRFDCQLRLRRRGDGMWRWHLSRAEPMRGPDGHVERWFGTSTDIEDQKRTEAELATERVRAEEANHAKDEFLAVLSHELRTPLNAVLGWVTMLRSGALPADKREHALEIVDRNAHVQARLIEELLDVSRIIVGSFRVERVRVDLARVIDAAVESVRPALEARPLRLDARVAAGPMIVWGDPARLQQVVWNMLTNALKFTPPGGEVRVTARVVDDRAVVAVADTGLGIDPSFLPYVFDQFRQAEGASVRAQGGLGLGLSIARHLVALHGGALRAESDGLGRGATFTMEVPLDAECDTREPRESGERLSVPSQVESLHGARVLVVEDDPDAREMMSIALSGYGAVVETAGSVAEARRAFDRALPDLVVSDIGLPGENGYVLARELHERAARGGVRVPAVALTGYAGLEDRRRASDAGFDRHMPKPVDLDELARVVTQLRASSRRAG